MREEMLGAQWVEGHELLFAMLTQRLVQVHSLDAQIQLSTTDILVRRAEIPNFRIKHIPKSRPKHS